jgi:murein DD-endopeptidase MepM/ murein hydrolase activator NlpD
VTSRSPLTMFALALLLVLGGVLGWLILLADSQASASACAPAGPGVTIDSDQLPATAVAGYRGEQLLNAAYVMNAGQALGMSARGQAIGVMTAMGESSLRIVDHGDSAGPDSRGLFQQRATGWGSYADRMDPTISSTNFFKALAKVEGWETLPPTIAAHRSQRNADPYHYERFWDPAVQVVTALAGAELPGIAPGTGALACTASSPAAISTDGWTRPAVGPVTSKYGMRVHPITGEYKLHSGTDLGAACDSPIYAAAPGVVVQAGAAGGYGNLITIDHGSGVVSRYGHMYNNGVLAHVGDQVNAGRQIARVGSNGYATGCHLHFEIRLNNTFTDPVPWMSQHGAPL